VYEDVLTPGVFGLEARIGSAAELDTHLHSASFGALLGALSVLAQEVDMSIWQPTAEFGADALEIIRRLRQSPKPVGSSSDKP
jgi:hypothetical protein